MCDSTAGTQNVTLAEIAKMAGVSSVTVSRAINTPHLVKPETLQAVRAVIDRTGYVPNLLAGGLASRKSRLIAAVVPSVSSTMFSETIESLNSELVSAGYQLLLGVSGYDPAREFELVSAVLARRPDGIILTGLSHLDQTTNILRSAQLPIVEIWDLSSAPLDMAVGFSHHKAGQLVAEHLAPLNHERYAQIGAKDERGLQRRAGYIQGLAASGIFDVPLKTVNAPGSFREGREMMAELLDEGGLSLAVFCSSDLIAQGALAEVQARNLSIPQQVAIVGFGDFAFSAYTHPPLTTVRVDRADIGSRAAKCLLSRLNGLQREPSVIDVGFEMVVRETA
ncbi:LacI family gluconate utilization system Gnt-I transcriptional repressor [Neorhizobium sp. 2083]|uniref:LacI family DNA-binding transcriptional regulator n=1 Tax=Neorhizobium sp. 2083 TaxID=2817762 RepID=UPI0028614A84|nr:LacI family DNA-binding transcriptional regulator [Neorhizobium sp. 2083]MDR6817897.1 LacI family gluconate utilization system Gnt-I transcriptional repressor [Neorhizobium sp. 2083]